MVYGYTDTDAEKNYYEVHIRATKTYEDPDYANLLHALANDLAYFGEVTAIVGDGTADQGDEAIAVNKVYELDGTTATCTLDLATAVNGTANGQILVFKAINLDNSVRVTDEAGSPATHIFVDVNDIIVYYWDYASDDWIFAFQSASGDTSTFATYSPYFTEIGVLEEGPMVMTEQADTKVTNKGDTLSTKNVKFEANDLQVNEANNDFYNALVAAGNVDLLYYNPNNLDHSVAVLNFSLDKYLAIKGNTWNTIPLIGTKETTNANIGSYLKLFEDLTP